jgi:hypothetical protein
MTRAECFAEYACKAFDAAEATTYAKIRQNALQGSCQGVAMQRIRSLFAYHVA